MDSFQILLEKTEKQKDYRQGAISVLDERGKFVSFKNQDFIGVLHIYKHKIPESYSSVSNLSNILAFLAVPSYFSTQSLLSFIGKYQSCISNFRIIRDSLDSRYLVLMKFATRDDADLFYAEFNGSLYNHDQGERCHVVYISSVLFSSNNELEPLVLEESDVFFTNIDSIKDKIELPNCPVCLVFIPNLGSHG